MLDLDAIRKNTAHLGQHKTIALMCDDIERLRAALTEFCDVIAEDEEHGDGAYDSNCQVCVVHAKCRALLSDKGDKS